MSVDWDEFFRRQFKRFFRRNMLVSGKDLGWVPEVGELVCDCRFQHQRVVSVDVETDEVILEDGMNCSYRYCLDPVDHEMSDHPEGYRET